MTAIAALVPTWLQEFEKEAGYMSDKKEYQVVTCPKCGGTGIWEENHGLLSGPCEKCGGKGKVKRKIEVKV